MPMMLSGYAIQSCPAPMHCFLKRKMIDLNVPLCSLSLDKNAIRLTKKDSKEINANIEHFYELESLLSARGRYFSQSDLRAWKTTLASPPHMKWATFQVYFSNSARVIGYCAHSSLLVRGRSSARTTYFPVWAQ